MSPLRHVLPVFLLGALLMPGAGAEGEWPFGKDPSAGPFSRGQDLYNLGVLGAKTRDAEAAAPHGDAGPTRLRVVLLYADGPAARAGLRPGDVIVGVGRRVFKEGSLAALAEALRKAESGKGKLTVLVERSGEKRRKKIEVALPTGGKAAAKPTQGTGRKAIFDAALAWLAERQKESGGFDQTLSGTNGEVVMASIAGLAWLAGGSDLEDGPYAENVRKAARFVIENAGVTLRLPMGGGGPGGDRLGRMQGTDQTNWGHAHAGIFLGELFARNAKAEVRAALHASADALVKVQEPSGGWAHGPGGPNPLGYTELNIVTGLAMSALAMAARADYEIPEGVWERAEAYLQASGGGDGGVGYSDQPGQKGMGNIGRTAAAWLAYRTLGRAKGGWGRKMGKYVERHAADVLGGHASLMQHILLAGVAAHAAGGKTESGWWKSLERDLVLARAPDGSLQPRPWHESLSIGSNSDVTFGEVWTTAAWAVVLGCRPSPDDRPGLPRWMGLEKR